MPVGPRIRRAARDWYESWAPGVGFEFARLDNYPRSASNRPTLMSPGEYQELTEFIAKQFDKQRAEFTGRFEQIDRRFEPIDRRFEQIEARLASVEVSLEANRDLIRLNAEAIAMNGEAIRRAADAIRRNEQAILRLDGKVMAVDAKLDAFRREVGERLERLEAA